MISVIFLVIFGWEGIRIWGLACTNLGICIKLVIFVILNLGNFQMNFVLSEGCLFLK